MSRIGAHPPGAPAGCASWTGRFSLESMPASPLLERVRRGIIGEGELMGGRSGRAG